MVTRFVAVRVQKSRQLPVEPIARPAVCYMAWHPPQSPDAAPLRRQLVYWPVILGAGFFAWLVVGGLIAGLVLLNRSSVGDRLEPPPASVVLPAPAAPEKTATVKEEPPNPATPPSAPVEAPAKQPAQTPRSADSVDRLTRRDSSLPESEVPLGGGDPDTQNFGTQVEFVCDPLEAARQATKEHKLLFLVHLSGNLEDDKFT